LAVASGWPPGERLDAGILPHDDGSRRAMHPDHLERQRRLVGTLCEIVDRRGHPNARSVM
jgi:alkanesulfonate monooxygenase SsuD/methylene tetrahydromethanopterin reductase-like flavin-dependent oxidoreductase (luciferase family)